MYLFTLTECYIRWSESGFWWQHRNKMWDLLLPVWGGCWGEVWGFLLFEHDETRMFASRQQDAADQAVSCWELSDRGSHQQRPALVCRDVCVCVRCAHLSVPLCHGVFFTLYFLLFKYWIEDFVSEGFKTSVLLEHFRFICSETNSFLRH